MIDIENALFTLVKNEIKDICPYSGTSEKNEAPSDFPYMLFVQKDNPPLKESRDSGSNENHVQPMIQIDVFSSASKQECKNIHSKIDDSMQSKGFERIFGAQPINTGSTYYRMVSRYQGIVRKNGTNDYTVY